MNKFIMFQIFIAKYLHFKNFLDAALNINDNFDPVNCTFQSDVQDSLSVCEQCKNEVLNTCSSPSLSTILSVAVTCLLTIIIHVIIIVIFTITMKRKSKQKFMLLSHNNCHFLFQAKLRINHHSKIS